MAKENLQNDKLNLKVVVFWSLILIITILFAILFAMRIYDTRTFNSYDDIAKADLNLVYDIKSEKGEYYVYIYSAKENNEGKLVDTNRTDIEKANEILPTVFNYFNYVRRNERELGDKDGFCKIYGYNVNNNAKDSNLTSLNLKLEQLPALVLISDSKVTSTYEKVTDIRKQLQSLMK